jgi:CheY-like chemotaxis protein
MKLVPNQPAPKTVLVIEDDSSLVFLWEVLLEEIDPSLAIKSFSDAARAEAFLFSKEGENCQAVICDFILRGNRNSLELWDRIREKKIPFLLATAFSEEELRDLLPKRADWPSYANKAKGIDHLASVTAELMGLPSGLPTRSKRALTMA